MALNDDALLAAVTSGIDTAGGAPATTEETPNETADETNTGDAGEATATGAEGAGDGGDGTDGAGADGESAAGDDADAGGETDGEGAGDRGDGRNAKGEFVAKKKDGEQPGDGKTAAPGADGKPAAAAAKPAAGKDPVNDPIPQGLKKETQERMVALVNTAKTLTAERDQFKGQYEEIMGYISESRATPEQYGQALEYLGWVNSGDPAKIQKCISFMQTELAALSKLAGIPVNGVDLLADHADLKQEVADGAISRQRAEEIAASRNHQAMRAGHARVVNEQDAHQQLITQGRNQLNALEAELQANDPHYAYKKGILVESLKGVFAQIDPRKWRSSFKAAYDRIPNPAPAAKPAARTVPGTPGAKAPANQPLRARNPAGAQAAAPKSLLDAVSQGIANAG